MRRINVPPVWRAYSQLNKAVRAPPMWRKPVGLGANRTRTFIVGLRCVAYPHKASVEHGTRPRLCRRPAAESFECTNALAPIWPIQCFSRLSQIMLNTFEMVVIGWLAVVSLLVVAYLASLTIEEKRRNRRMNAERHRLGLSV